MFSKLNSWGKIVVLGFLFFVIGSCASCACYTVNPGERGIVVTMGKITAGPVTEGLGFKMPVISRVERISIKQQSQELASSCYSSDLQQMAIHVRVIYRIPESSVVPIFQNYAGNPFDAYVAPRVHESLKEATATRSAEKIVKEREDIRKLAIELTKAKLGNLIVLEDLALQNIDLSSQLEQAIEQKMVQEQEAAKSKFIQQRAEVEAQTAIIKAKGEAEAIRIRGDALTKNPKLIELQMIEKWNGEAPQTVVSGGGGSNIILPVGK